MTNTDNKDPQIREAFEKFHAEQFGWELTRPEHYQDNRVAERFRIWQAATTQQAAELKQLRADNEISESTQAALYKSLLIIQRKYEQLRAERAGLIAEIDKEIIKLEPRLYKTDSEIEILYKFKKLKSKLTDSAQITTDTEGK